MTSVGRVAGRSLIRAQRPATQAKSATRDPGEISDPRPATPSDRTRHLRALSAIPRPCLSSLSPLSPRGFRASRAVRLPRRGRSLGSELCEPIDQFRQVWISGPKDLFSPAGPLRALARLLRPTGLADASDRMPTSKKGQVNAYNHGARRRCPRAWRRRPVAI